MLNSIIINELKLLFLFWKICICAYVGHPHVEHKIIEKKQNFEI